MVGSKNLKSRTRNFYVTYANSDIAGGLGVLLSGTTCPGNLQVGHAAQGLRQAVDRAARDPREVGADVCRRHG